MTVFVGVDNVCYNQTMQSGAMHVVGFLDRVASYGAEVVQMDPLWPAQGLSLAQSDLDRLGDMLDERDLQLVVKGNSGGKGTLAVPADEGQEAVALFQSKIKASAALGAPVVRIVTRAYPFPTRHTMPPDAPREEVIGWVITHLTGLARLAEDLNVKIAVENHGDLRIAELERILAEVDSPALGVQYDLLEQVAIFEDPRQAADCLMPHAFTVHWNDAYPILGPGGFQVAACKPGEGILDLDGVSELIAAQGRDIYVFTAFQAASSDGEDELVRAYLVDLQARFGGAARG